MNETTTNESGPVMTGKQRRQGRIDRFKLKHVMAALFFFKFIIIKEKEECKNIDTFVYVFFKETKNS